MAPAAEEIWSGSSVYFVSKKYDGLRNTLCTRIKLKTQVIHTTWETASYLNEEFLEPLQSNELRCIVNAPQHMFQICIIIKKGSAYSDDKRTNRKLQFKIQHKTQNTSKWICCTFLFATDFLQSRNSVICNMSRLQTPYL